MQWRNHLTAGDHYTNSGSWAFTNNFTESNITYDLNGNLKTYTRRGLTVAPSTFGVIDQMTYSFGDATRPDLLTDVQDAASSTKGFKDATSPGTNYTYDLNGNLTQDNNKSLTFNYNHLNLPNSINNPALSYITMTYTAVGEKLTKVSSAGTRNYIESIEYLGANTDAIYHAEGRCITNGASFYYQYTLKDHLGSARMNFQANGTAVLYLEAYHYYPFGMLLEGIGTPPPTNNKYLYNGKELNEDLGLNLYDYGARWYDPAVGRFTNLDPLSAFLPRWSGYHFSFNNPLIFNDPSGLAPEKTTEEIVQEAWDATPENGNASFDDNGDCTCGCAGTPPCSTTDGKNQQIIDVTTNMVYTAWTTIEDGFGNYVLLPALNLFAGKAMTNAIKLELQKMGIGIGNLSDYDINKIFELRKINGEFNVILKAGGFEALVRTGVDALNILGIIYGGNGILMAKIPMNFKLLDDAYLELKKLDPHQIKRDWLGDSINTGHFDLFKNTNTGKISIFDKKGHLIEETDIIIK